MAGIYIHIPFCKQRCTYCDFYTQVAPHLIPETVNAIKKELIFRKDYLDGKPIDTIYFGGGTPSLLSFADFTEIFSILYTHFEVNTNAEVTFEANPDDLSIEFLESIKQLPFNRISIGIQTFDDLQLKQLNRRHNSFQAIEAVKNAQKVGFDNISIDLIYGLPTQSFENWNKQLDMAFQLGVQHISVYGLTYEEGTALWKKKEKGKITVVDDDTMIEMYRNMLQRMEDNGFEAYEISNFALPGFFSRHNSSYWEMKSYLGIGPSAHSYNGLSRRWNISSTPEYIHFLNSGEPFFECEILSLKDMYNDFCMVSLRTRKGIDMVKLSQLYGTEMADFCMKNAESFIHSGHLFSKDNRLALTVNGIQISDYIIGELMYVDK